MQNIINVVNYLSSLGDTNPITTWHQLKETDEALQLCSLRDEYSNEYLNSSFSSYIKSKYEKLKNIPTAKIIVDDIGFNSEKELEGYLKSILKSIPIGEYLKGANKSFLANLLSRSSLIASDCKKYGPVMFIRVNTKPEFAGKFFEVIYENGRTQTISIMKYLNPSTNILVDMTSLKAIV